MTKQNRSAKALRQHLSAAAGRAAPKKACFWIESIEPRLLLSGLTPAQVRGAYGLTGLTFGSTGANGAGETIAIIDEGDDPNLVDSGASNFATSDLGIFDANYGLVNPPSFIKMGFTDGSSPTLTTSLPGAAQSGFLPEVSLDVEWAHVMAPNANILLVEANAVTGDDSNGILAVDAAAPSMHIVALSMSYGGYEDASTALAQQDDSQYFDTPSLVYLGSSGDNGAYGTGGRTISVDEPASSVNVVAVGGTTLGVSGNSWASESTWGNGTTSYQYGGGGGGFSSVEPQPAYQVGKVNGLTTTARAVPDISLDANSGVNIYDSADGGWLLEGGTSLSCPLMAGIVAVIDQGRAVNGSLPLASSGGAGIAASNPNGNPSVLDIHALIYGLGYANGDFHDITTGNSIGPAGYGPLTGYDVATGLGSPNGSKFITDLVAASPFPTTITVTAPSTAYTLQVDSSGTYEQLLVNGTLTYQVAQTSLGSTGLTFNLNGSGDSLTVNETNGYPFPAGGITVTGKSTGDTLTIVGLPGGSQDFTVTSNSIMVDSSTINFSNVSLNLNPGTYGDALFVDSGSITITAQTPGSGLLLRDISQLYVASGATLTFATAAAHDDRMLVYVQGGTVSGKLDAGGNDVLFNGAAISTINPSAVTGYSGGTWGGQGLASSAAQSNSSHLTALGVSPRSAYGGSYDGTSGSFDGFTSLGSDVLVKYTYYGDANLDGKVDGSDYSRIDSGYLQHLTGWANGDFNYDGVVNGSDYTLIDNAYNRQGASLAAQIAQSPPARPAGAISSLTPPIQQPAFFNDPASEKHRRLVDEVGLADR